MKQHTLLSALAAFGFLVYSCQKDFEVGDPALEPKLPSTPYDYVSGITNAPSWFVDSLIPSGNPVTNDGATLGRVLFYDKILSRNNSVACASCHSAQFGYADFNAFSVGFQLKATTRNAMPIINPSQTSSFFWDTRVPLLEDMVLNPVQNHIEMGMEDLDYLIIKLKSAAYYPGLFEKAFGTPDITEKRVSNALAQFLRSMVSYNSKYDQGREISFTNFTYEESLGRQLFFNVLPCGNCHDQDRLGGRGVTANVGLDFNYADDGLMGITGNSDEEGKFKIPSLRNIGITAPYMHDGRFATLAEVIRFYNQKIEANPNLSFPLSENVTVVENHGYGDPNTVVIQTQPVVPLQFDLTDQDITHLVAFLNTLTDYDYITDVKFSDPFK